MGQKTKSRTVELVHSSYQPTKAELSEKIVVDGSLEQIAQKILRPIKPRWIKKPRHRR